jgi:hypothetical protein
MTDMSATLSSPEVWNIAVSAAMARISDAFMFGRASGMQIPKPWEFRVDGENNRPVLAPEIGEAIENVTEKRPEPEVVDFPAIREGKPGKLATVAKGKADRITIERAGGILGLAIRTVQKMSQRGQLPGAALMGRRWTYDEDKLHGYVRNQERAVWQGRSKHRQGVTGKTVSFTVASRSTAKPTDDHYSRVIQKSRDAVAQRKKKNL